MNPFELQKMADEYSKLVGVPRIAISNYLSDQYYGEHKVHYAVSISNWFNLIGEEPIENCIYYPVCGIEHILININACTTRGVLRDAIIHELLHHKYRDQFIRRIVFSTKAGR